MLQTSRLAKLDIREVHEADFRPHGSHPCGPRGYIFPAAVHLEKSKNYCQILKAGLHILIFSPGSPGARRDQQYYRAGNRPETLGSREAAIGKYFVVIPVKTIWFLIENSGFLFICSTDIEKYQDFNPANFVAPDPDWTPPYPYHRDDVIFSAVKQS